MGKNMKFEIIKSKLSDTQSSRYKKQLNNCKMFTRNFIDREANNML